MGAIISNGIIYSGGGSGSGASIVEVTQEQYDSLSESERNNGTIYYITDATEDILSASSISYDNKSSGLSSTNVEDAINELSSAKPVNISESDYLANKDKYDKTDNIYFTQDATDEDYVIFASEVYMDTNKKQTVKDKIETAIGNLTFSVSGSNLVITDGTNKWTIAADK